MNWLEAMKLALITSAVAALQYFRHQLAADEQSRRRHTRDRSVLDDLPVDVRQACLSLIDNHAMPLLVDTWR